MNHSKPTLALVDFDFVADMARALEDGLYKGRKPDGWKQIEWTPEMELQYKSALLRHYHAYAKGGDVVHLAAIANNAMILAHHERKKKDDGKNMQTDTRVGSTR